MFRLTRNGTDRLDIEFGGKLAADDMANALEGALIPGLTIKAFGPGEAADAEARVAGG